MKIEDFDLLEESMSQALAFKNGDETAARVETIGKPDDVVIDEYRLRLEEAKEIIIDLLNQFAYTGQKDGRAMLWTSGLSALEWGFEFVGWDNPHFTPELECEQTDCHAMAECGANTPSGYKRLCSKHFHELDLISYLLDNGSPLSSEESHAMNASIEKLYNKTGRKIIIGNEPN